MVTALDHLSERIRAAAADGTPLRLRGGGTRDFHGAALEGEVLDTRGHAGIVSHEPSELVVTARCGTPLAELEAALAAHGQCLPFEPPHLGAGATVGGMVASGFAGPARAASGGVRDYLLGVSLIDGLGQPLTFGGQVMKNVAGYDVSRLMAGSWGTLALVTEVSLKVLPVAPAEATLRFDGVTEAEAIDRLNRWAGRPLPLNASCWQPDGVLWLRLRGARAAVDAAVRSLGGQAVGEADARAWWSALREQTAPFFALAPGECLWRVAVPDTAAPLALGDTLLEWHGAQRWIKRAAADADRVRAAVAAAGGHATLWRAYDGRCRPEAFTPLAGAVLAIHQRLKREFDPRGVLGRGRMGAAL